MSIDILSIVDGGEAEKTDEEGDKAEVGADGDPERRQRMLDEADRQVDDRDTEREPVAHITSASFPLSPRTGVEATDTPTIHKLIARFGRP